MRRPALLALLALAACDTSTSDTLTFDGVEVEVRGDATLDLDDGQLVVSGLTGGRSGGFTVAGTPGRVDVVTDPVEVPVGGRFGIEVEDSDGTDIASIYNEATGDGTFDVQASFADALAVPAVTVRYRLDGELVFSIPRLALVPSAGGRQRAASSVGEGSGDPGSVHVIRDRGRYIVVSDSEGAPDDARRACAGFLIVPPSAFGSEFPDGLCTDWIEVEPLGVESMPVGRVAVTARGVGTFRVRELRTAAETTN